MAQISLLQVTKDDITYALEVTTLTKSQIEEELKVIKPELEALESLVLETDEQIVEKHKAQLVILLAEAKNTREVHKELLQEKRERLSLLKVLNEQIELVCKEKAD